MINYTPENKSRQSIDPRSITIVTTTSAPAEAVTESNIIQLVTPPSPEKGGKGGEGGVEPPPLPPLLAPPGAADVPKTNAAFLGALFPSIRDGERVAVCSKHGDPTTGPWNATDAATVDKACPPKANNYFNCSTFRLDSEGGLKARKDMVERYAVLVFDDIGTKVPLERTASLPPTYAIETSPGNYQYGYALAVPVDNLDVVTRLQSAVSAAGLSDIAAMGTARWARLPYAVNGKAKHRDADGKPFVCRLTIWSPGLRYTLDDIYLGFGLNPAMAIAIRAPLTMPRTRNMPAELSHEVYRPQLPENPVVTALKERGFYKSDKGQGTHEITCPWIDEHTDQIDSGAAYFEPSSVYPAGGFKCHHSHGERLAISNLLSKIDVEPRAARNRSEIRYEPGAIDQVVKACDYIMSQTGTTYQAGGAIVELRRNEEGDDVRTEAATQAEITMSLAANCTFLAYNRKEKEWRPCDPPERVVRTFIGASRYAFLPPLRGIARQPYYRPKDGKLVTEPGYDSASGIYAEFDGKQVVLGPPTREGAMAAVAKLEELLSEFIFESDTDKAAAIAAMLTATVRPSLPFAPAFLTTAPESGTGKSYLNSIITAFAGGQPARASFPLTADEATKSILSLLLSAPACIEYDDMVCNFKPHAILNRALTSESITDRILGISKTATVSTRVFIIGSGINVAPERDMNRRVIAIRLASCPIDRISRTFKGRPAELVRERRMEMVGAALTIIQAWKAAGCPRGNVLPIASYGDDWADHCRHPLIWLGYPDPAQPLFDQVEDDSDSEALGNLLQVWHEIFGNVAVTVREVVSKSTTVAGDRLLEALEEIPILDGKSINPSKFGWYLSKNAKRIVGGLRVVEGRAKSRRTWQVERVAKVAPPLPPLPDPYRDAE